MDDARATVFVYLASEDSTDRLHLCAKSCEREFLRSLGIPRRRRGRMQGSGFNGSCYEVTVRQHRVDCRDFCDLCGDQWRYPTPEYP